MRELRGALVAAAIGVGLLVVAASFDAEPLYVGGLAFALTGVGAVAWVRLGSIGLVVERGVAERTVVEDDPVAVTIVVRSGVGRLPTGTVQDPGLGRTVALRAGRPQTTLRLRASFARRGRRVLAPVRVVVRDPLGLAARTVTAGAPVELLVLPRVSPVLAPDRGAHDGPVTPRAGRPRFAAEVELDGLRPHRPGAPASRIHWSVFARTGELWERRLTSDVDARPLVVLDARLGADDPVGGLDAAVRAVASLTVHLARAGGCGLLLPGDRRPIPLDAGLTGWSRLHVRLALVAGGPAPALGGIAGRRGAVIYVAARTGAGVPRVLAHAPTGGRVLVVPGELPGRRAAFVVAGCTGYELSGARAGAAGAAA